jgi:hypothetical protein
VVVVVVVVVIMGVVMAGVVVVVVSLLSWSLSAWAVRVRRLQLHWEWATKTIHQIPRSKTPPHCQLITFLLV